jgi:hypothetical protein
MTQPTELDQDGGSSGSSDGETRRQHYDPPAIVFRERLEVMASNCNKTGSQGECIFLPGGEPGVIAS